MVEGKGKWAKTENYNSRVRSRTSHKSAALFAGVVVDEVEFYDRLAGTDPTLAAKAKETAKAKRQ